MNVRAEIGSEFWDIPVSNTQNSLFPDNSKWFLAGRTALLYIILDSDIKSVSMPRWSCGSMVAPFVSNGVKVSFYDDTPETDKDAIFVMDYFGYDTKSKVPDGYHGVVIRDITHSVFSRTYDDADYYFGSLRKWAGFLTGGVAWGKWRKQISIPPYDREYVSLRQRAMKEKCEYINGIRNDKGYLDVFSKCGKMLENIGLSGAYEGDVEAAKYFDVVLVKKRRRENANELLKCFSGMFTLGENDCPMFVPVLLQERDKILSKLIEEEIYCPVHWPENNLEGKELSIVCDQRYRISDMKRICREFIKCNG